MDKKIPQPKQNDPPNDMPNLTISIPLGTEEPAVDVYGKHRTVRVDEAGNVTRIYVQLPGIRINPADASGSKGGLCAVGIVKVFAKVYAASGKSPKRWAGELRDIAAALFSEGKLLVNPRLISLQDFSREDLDKLRQYLKKLKDGGVWETMHNATKQNRIVKQMRTGYSTPMFSLFGDVATALA